VFSYELGDRLGERHLHLYWRHFPQGPGPVSNFKKATIDLMDASLSRWSEEYMQSRLSDSELVDVDSEEEKDKE